MVSIIILNFNGKEFLSACINSVLDQSFQDFEIILVDNGSTDESINFIKKEFNIEKIKVISSEVNLGFAGGNNLGLQYAKGEYIVLLNNDTVVDKDWLRSLFQTLNKSEHTGIVQSLVITEGIAQENYKKNGTINLLGHNIMQVFDIDKNGVGEIFQANGCSLIIRKSTINEIGGLFLDEYFAYAEDSFLSFKVKFAGYKIFHDSKSIVYHKGHSTTKNEDASKMFFYQERNRILNFKLFFSDNFQVKYKFLLLLNFLIKLFASLFFHKYNINSLFRAYKWLRNNKKWIYREKSKLLVTRKEEEILKMISGKLFNGVNLFQKTMNVISLFYCKIFKIKVIELN